MGSGGLFLGLGVRLKMGRFGVIMGMVIVTGIYVCIVCKSDISLVRNRRQ